MAMLAGVSLLAAGCAKEAPKEVARVINKGEIDKVVNLSTESIQKLMAKVPEGRVHIGDFILKGEDLGPTFTVDGFEKAIQENMQRFFQITDEGTCTISYTEKRIQERYNLNLTPRTIQQGSKDTRSYRHWGILPDNSDYSKKYYKVEETFNDVRPNIERIVLNPDGEFQYAKVNVNGHLASKTEKEIHN